MHFLISPPLLFTYNNIAILGIALECIFRKYFIKSVIHSQDKEEKRVANISATDTHT